MACALYKQRLNEKASLLEARHEGDYIISGTIFFVICKTRRKYSIYFIYNINISIYRMIRERTTIRRYLCQKFQQQNQQEKENLQVLHPPKEVILFRIVLKLEQQMWITSLVSDLIYFVCRFIKLTRRTQLTEYVFWYLYFS